MSTPSNEDLSKLCEAISSLSEDCYCASWLIDCEYTLWAMMQAGGPKHGWGMGEVMAADLEELRELSARVGGWVHWVVKDDGDASENYLGTGPQFVPLDEWQKMYAARAGRFEMGRP